ncbi:MAG: family 20 glycosylhydrolase [Bacteroidales bacterium]|nr:family 20 glycosylhydrolase [Bacteroidales bacterium]
MKNNKVFILMAAMALSIATAAGQIDFLPLPVSVEYGEGTLVLDKNVRITGGDSFNVSYLGQHLARVFNPSGDSWRKGEPAVIEFVRTRSFPEEGYSLQVLPDRIIISSSTKAGEFYAIQTLLQMLPAQVYRKAVGPDAMMLRQWEIPCVKIYDQPRFEWRGSMLDVSRNFFDKDYIIRHIDFLAYHKINKFHWHLTDDNGWRVEIKKYPKLTATGAWRGRDEALMPAYNSGEERYGGYYTQDEIRQIVAYAADRNIEIIPEFDLPGHSKALAVSYPEMLCNHSEELLSVQGETRNVICVGREKNYQMLDNIIKELASLFPSKYLHIGVEEVVTESWKHCPDCQKLMQKLGMTDEKELLGYFSQRMEKILAKHGKTLEGWEDIIPSKDLSRNDLVLVWHNQNVMQKAIDAGYNVVTQNCFYLYLDMKQSPAERGHTWASIIPVEKLYSFDPLQDLTIEPGKEKLVKGLQAGLWTEMLFYPPHFSEYQMFPRLCALAEVGWTPQAARDYAGFDSRLAGSHFERMWNMGIRFRIPAPEVDAQCNVRSPYHNMVVRYTFDGTEPTVNSPVAYGRILTDHPEKLRFATFYNDIRSIVVEVPGARRYLTPTTHVTTTLDINPRYPLENLEAYERGKYVRTAGAPEAGQFLCYTFEEPLRCSRITVQTADPVNNFFGITQGHVEVSYDGITFTPAGEFDMYNRVVIVPEKEVCAVRIVVDGPCEGKAVSIQHLIIE